MPGALAAALAHMPPDDHLHGAMLVFQRYEERAVSGVQLLAQRHDAAGADLAVVWHALQVFREQQALGAQAWTQ